MAAATHDDAAAGSGVVGRSAQVRVPHVDDGEGGVCVRPVYARDDAPRCTADGLRAAVAERERPVRVPRYSSGVVLPRALLWYYNIVLPTYVS